MSEMTTLETVLDLDACAQEPIHIPGSIQPHGLMLVANPTSQEISHAAGDVAGKLGVGTWIGEALGAVIGDAVAGRVAQVTQSGVLGGYAGRLTRGDRSFDVLAHLSGERLIVELEPSHGEGLQAPALLAQLEAAGAAFERAPNLKSLCERAAVEFRRLTGFDRVMIYRFLEEDAGAVLAEHAAEDMPSFLNHRFPGSDIPAQARALYVRNLVRTIPDVGYRPAPLDPAWTEAEPLDMSDCALRSVSPVHMQYLRNMGVGASASVSIVKDGVLWGLIACHHRTPRAMPYDVRAAARALAGGLAGQVRAKEDAEGYRERLRLRGLEDEVTSRFARIGGLEPHLDAGLGELKRILDADGVAALRGETVHLEGVHPPEEAVRALARLALAMGPDPVVTDRLSTVVPDAEAYAAQASGMLGLVVAAEEPFVLLWFRAEQLEVVNWAGNPHKAVSVGPGEVLTPRSSFEAWRETVRGRSRLWSLAEVDAALRLREALLEMRGRRRLVDLNRQLGQALDEKEGLLLQKEVLLREVNHRVQNSLQLVSSFLGLQARDAGDALLTTAFDEARRRLGAVALVHRRLYRGDQIETVDLARYFEDLIGDMASSMGDDWTGQIHLDAEPVLAPTDRAVTLGLVVTELVINANKYAYGGAAGPIQVSVQEARGVLTVAVADHGRGKHGPAEGFGSRMMAAMVRQLGGEIAYTDNRPGLRAVLTVPIGVVARAAQP
jgi:light-regulated signal transduction histidine kinase (bacteriophytochrome)